jgi:hypothetical protein
LNRRSGLAREGSSAHFFAGKPAPTGDSRFTQAESITVDHLARKGKQARIEILIALTLGAVVFYAAFGFGILNPGHIEWLMHGDPAQHYFGWAFFRQEPWGWPPGLLVGLAAPLQTSIVFTDSIPLLALPLKLLDSLLPGTFQYFGLWMLACYLLLALFAWRLLTRLIHDASPVGAALRALGVLLVLLSPPLLLRGYGHEALMAHWLILAAINETLNPHRSRRWALWLGLALLTHAYLALMVAAFWFANFVHVILIRLGYSIQRRSGLAREKPRIESFASKPVPTPLTHHESFTQLSPSLPNLLIGSAFLWAGLLALAWLAGYIVPGSSALVAAGYGSYSANLLTYFDPMDWHAFNQHFGRDNTHAAEWSNFLPGLGHAHPDQYEGFAYLGAGGILALVTAILLMLFRPRNGQNVGAGLPAKPSSHDFSRASPLLRFNRLAPALLMAALLFLLGLSTHVTLGTHVLFDYRWPEPIQHVLEIFRASGRFVWPLYYLILILSVATLANRLRPPLALLALGLIVALQIYDLSPKFSEFHRHYHPASIERSTPGAPASADWASLTQNATQLIVLPRPHGDDYLPWVRLALAHRLSLNAGIVARADNNALHAHDAATLLALSADSDQLPPGSVIILTDPDIPVHPAHRILKHEGLRIILTP